jgi:hypothetical protein
MMAVIFTIRKRSEDEHSVSYFYGYGTETTDESKFLIVEKSTFQPLTPNGTPVDHESLSGGEDRALYVLAKARKKKGGWPEGYVFQA